MNFEKKDFLIALILIVLVNVLIHASVFLVSYKPFQNEAPKVGLCEQENIQHELVFFSGELYKYKHRQDAAIEFLTLIFSVFFAIFVLQLRIMNRKLETLEKRTAE